MVNVEQQSEPVTSPSSALDGFDRAAFLELAAAFQGALRLVHQMSGRLLERELTINSDPRTFVEETMDLGYVCGLAAQSLRGLALVTAKHEGVA